MRQPLKLALKNDSRSPCLLEDSYPLAGLLRGGKLSWKEKEVEMRKTQERLDYPEVVKSSRCRGRLCYFNWILPIVRK